MTDFYLILNPKNYQKPFDLVRRDFDGIETDYTTVCSMKTEDAVAMESNVKGISFKGQPIDWDKFFKEVQLYEAKAKVKLLESQMK